MTTIEKLIVRNYADMVKAGEGIIDIDQVRKIEVDAVADTGTTYVCISREHIEALGLPFRRNVEIRTANGTAERWRSG